MPNHHLSGFKMQQQWPQTNWCWAAVTASTAKFYNQATPWTMCRLAEYLLQSAKCCAHPEKCDRTFATGEALKRIGRLEQQTDKAEDWATCDREITAERPLGVRIEWESNRPGHAVMIVGIETATDERVTVADPDWDERTMSWDELASNYQGTKGRWVRSWFTKK